MKRYILAFLVLFLGCSTIVEATTASVLRYFDKLSTGSAQGALRYFDRLSTGLAQGDSGDVMRWICQAEPVEARIHSLVPQTPYQPIEAEALPTETPLTEAEIRAFKEAVRRSATQMESLSADFTQSRHSRYLAQAAESRGKLLFMKPGRVLWRYTFPSPYSVLFLENRMYINDNGKKKDVNAGKRMEKLNKLVAGSVTGDMFDAPEFTFSYARSGEKILVRLTTREVSLKKYIREIGLTFENNTVSEVKMTEPSEDYTRIILKNKVFNGRMDASVFVP